MGNELELFGSKETMPAHLVDTSGLGNENVSEDDMAIPFLNLLQALSPEVSENQVPGATAGLLFNSITKELHEEVFVSNLTFSKEFSIFKKRNLGGGYNGSFPTREEARIHLENEVDGNSSDYDIVETHRHVCLLIDPTTQTALQPVMINMANTKLRVSKKWNTEIQVQGGQADRFAGVWRISTVLQGNTKGKFYNLAIDFAGWTNEELYAEAKGFYEKVVKA